MKTRFALLFCLLFVAATRDARQSTDLFLRGYSIIPAPQKVELRDGEIEFDESWRYDARAVAPNHIAIRALAGDLKSFHHLALQPHGGGNVIRLSVAKGAVETGLDAEIEKQAYSLKIAPGAIQITGNSDQGLFYGVQTLLQLLKPGPRGRLLLPVCEIEDWPRLQLRFLHWDTKHHQDRVETLKRYLDWSARFKVNMIGFELEDKFEYPSNPIIGAPGAFTSAELQEIVNYGLERFIQVVPQVQSPAHMAYALKHPQFAHLRADGNNYQSEMCDERTYQIIFQMYDDAVNATKGVDYFFVSTDEVYYVGIGDKCGKPYTPENRSLRWVEFVRRARDHLAARGRRMLVWAEYPLLPEHVRMLPPDIIDGVIGEPEYAKTENEMGIRQLAYVSMQGAEFLFPNHLLNNVDPGGDSGPSEGRLRSTAETISSGRVWQGKPIGVFGAAWGDSGLHNETFWLGWATVAQYGWHPHAAPVEQTAAEFMNLYHGPRVVEMAEVYRGLQTQARFFERSWDRVVSKARGPGYGNSYGKGIGTTRRDETLPQPAMPAMPDLTFKPVYVDRYRNLVADAGRMALENDVLIHRIRQNISRADRNRYNLEVFLSLAELTGHHNRMVMAMKAIEDKLNAAREQAEKKKPEDAVGRLVAAYDQARQIVEERSKTFASLKAVWEKSRFPKGREVGGKKFYHVLDDVKDHWADRRADLSYMIAPEESIGLEQWMKSFATVIREYAQKHNVPVSALKEPRLEQ